MCVSFLSIVRVMTSSTNPLDWDYSSSRAVAVRLEAEDWTSLACLPVSLAVCLRSVPHTSSMTSPMTLSLLFYQKPSIFTPFFDISVLASYVFSGCFLSRLHLSTYEVKLATKVPFPAIDQLFASVGFIVCQLIKLYLRSNL